MFFCQLRVSTIKAAGTLGMDQQVIVIKAASQWIAPGAGVVSQLVGNVHSHILHFIYTFSPRNASNTTTNRGRRFSSHRSSSTKDYNLYGLYYTFVCLRNCINVLRYAWQGVQSPFQHHTSSRQGYHALLGTPSNDACIARVSALAPARLANQVVNN